jgi:hypothetical protein
MTNTNDGKSRRTRGERSIYWSDDRQRYVVEATVGYNANGKRVTRRGYGTSETARLGPEAVPEGLRQGETVLAMRAANMVISLRRP